MAHQQGQTEAVWRERLGRFHESGLTAKAFCEREGVSYSNFHAWKRRLGLGRSRRRLGVRRIARETNRCLCR